MSGDGDRKAGRDTERATPPGRVVELYWRPGCPFCMALRLRLRFSGLPVHEVDIWDDPRAAARVRAVTGGDETVPTVFVGEQALVNPGIRQVTRAVGEHAPELLDAADQPLRRRLFRPFRAAR